jgi:hypothetical protein
VVAEEITVQAKGLIAATAALAVAGGLIWWSSRHQPDEAAGSAASVKLLTLASSDIVKLELRREMETTRLEQPQPETFKLTAPEAQPADREQAGAVMRALASLTADKVIEEKPADLAGFGLAKPSTTVVATLRNGKTRTIKFGDDAPVGGGTFTQVDGDARVFLVNSTAKTSIDKLGVDLRDKHLVKFETEQVNKIELGALEFSRNAASEWTITKPRPLRADALQVEELLRQMKDARLDPLVTSDQQRDLERQFHSAQPLAIATVTSRASVEKFEVRKTKDSKYYAQSSSVAGFHLLTPEQGKAFERPVDEYRNKKLFDFGFTELIRVEIKADKLQRAFSKSGDKWLANLKAVDAAAVQALIDRLRGLTATKFADAGFTTAQIELTTTGESGKLTERVEISKTSSGYVARRQGEAALYELDAKAVDDIVKAAGDIKESAKSK